MRKTWGFANEQTPEHTDMGSKEHLGPQNRLTLRIIFWFFGVSKKRSEPNWLAGRVCSERCVFFRLQTLKVICPLG